MPDGHVVTDQEIVDCYLNTYDEAMGLGVKPAFELHVNMWSEDFRRVTPVALAVQDRGIPFNYTLDYSHVNFKIENPEEQDISGIREDVEGGPPDPRSVRSRQFVQRMARARHRALAAGALGRTERTKEHLVGAGTGESRLPVCRPSAGRRRAGHRPRHHVSPLPNPAPGEWHSPWYAYKLEPTKEVVRKVLRYHKADPQKRLDYITPPR